ncbi:MAG: hypothetical protein NTW87_00745 [Planctomycetota bacterium]|nr:hypothetical protein [Planctomycetota bacterium]
MSAITAVKEHIRNSGLAPAPHLRRELRELRRRAMLVRSAGINVELSPYLRTLLRITGEQEV